MVTDKFKVKQGITTTSPTTTSPAYDLVPTGTIAMWVSATTPDGWLLCDGTGFSNATYPGLATVLGDTYGVHSGSTYYQPNIKGRTVIGVGTGSGLTARTLGTAGGSETVAISNNIISHLHDLGSHTHTLGSHGHTSTDHTHGWNHSHNLANMNHTHTSGNGNNSHTHNSYFGLTTGSGTARARNQTTSGSFDSTHVFAAGDHSHTSNADTETINTVSPTINSNSQTSTSGGGTTSGPSTNNTTSYTGADSTISIMQKSYVFTYIIKT
jgi:microcystin-dependent protein